MPKKKSVKRAVKSVGAEQKDKISKTNKVPVFAKVISALYYAVAVVYLIGGFALMLGSNSLRSVPVFQSLSASTLISASLVMIVLAILLFFVARGLWRGRNWARMVAVVLSIVAVASGIVNGNIFSVIIDLLIGSYLLFSNEVKKTFT